MLHSLYRIITYIAWPYLRILPFIRAFRKKEIKNRIPERFGKTFHHRPDGKLIWFHAASNGEALSALPLIHAMLELPCAPTILVTTMTTTAAQLMEKRLPDDKCIHQFIPFDHQTWINRFHKHWSPDMAIWVESELWPNHLLALKEKNIPAMLVNARLSEKSLRRWKIADGWFRHILSAFDPILAQTQRDQTHLQALGIPHVHMAGNLKDIALPLPYDAIAFDDMRLSVGPRPTLLFASTHEGEEEIIAGIHKQLKNSFPDLLSIIVPRHPNRAGDIAKITKKHALNTSVRSLKMSPRTDTDIYIADTLNELGLFYRLCSVVFVGNSLNTKPGGGHNLLEPALLDCAIISGADLHNFSVLAKEMPPQGACRIVDDQNTLLQACKNLLQNVEQRQKMAQNALAYAHDKQSQGLDNILKPCETIFQTAGLV